MTKTQYKTKKERDKETNRSGLMNHRVDSKPKKIRETFHFKISHLLGINSLSLYIYIFYIYSILPY